MQFVYIAGPYTAPTYLEIDTNIRRAAEAFKTLAEAGVGAFCPHMHSAHFEVIAPDVRPSYWYELDLNFLRAGCDALLLLPGWEFSKGSLKEKAVAEQLGLPVFYDTEDAIGWSRKRYSADVNY